MKTEKAPENSAIIINEVQLILAEKRTSLASLRTGIAVFALPITVVSFLIVTSKNYDLIHVVYLFVPLVTTCSLLAVLGAYLIVRAVVKIHRYDRMIADLKNRHHILSKLID